MRVVRRQIAKDLVPDDAYDMTIEQATSFETDITSFVNELPSAYRLGQDYDPSQPNTTSSTCPVLLAQRCVLAIIANRAILKLFLPFLREGSGPTPTKPSHQAVLGTINASHSIIYACRIMHSLWRDSRPATFDFYDFGRTLFDAAVVCAHAVIQQPGSILAAEAMKCVTGALDVMRILSASKLHGESQEAIKITEMMKERAELARSSGSSDAAAGGKRKRAEDDDGRDFALTAGFQLPFVGPSVSSAKTEGSRPSLSVSSMSKIAASGPKKDEVRAPKPSAREKEKEKIKYPPVGIRSRTGSSQGQPPSVRQRTNSMAPSPGPANMVPPSPTVAIAGASPTTHNTASPEQSSQTSTPVSDPSVASFTYSSQTSQHPSPHQATQPEAVQRGGFAMDFAGGNSGELRQFSQEYASSPQTSSVYNESSNGSYSASTHPPSFRQTSSSEHLLYQHSTVPPFAYEQSRIPHSQPMPLSTYGMSAPMGGSMGTSIPSTPHSQTFMLGDKSAPFDHHVGKSELDRQMNHEYQPTATSHGIPITPTTSTYVQGWPQQPEMTRNQWEYYKYAPSS